MSKLNHNLQGGVSLDAPRYTMCCGDGVSAAQKFHSTYFSATRQMRIPQIGVLFQVADRALPGEATKSCKRKLHHPGKPKRTTPKILGVVHYKNSVKIHVVKHYDIVLPLAEAACNAHLVRQPAP